MTKFVILFLTAAIPGLTAVADEPAVKISVLDNTVLCVRASQVPENVSEQIHAANVPSHLDGTVLDLRFADDAATNAADYFSHHKSPLVVLVNSQTRGPAAALATQLRADASAILIGSSGAPGNLSPDIVVNESATDEKKFQDDPFFKAPPASLGGLSASNLVAFIDHTSEADLVRKRVKDGEEDGDTSTPRAEPPQPVVRDPALARAMDLFKAVAVFHESRG